MIKFFRNIRKSFLNEGKTTKYLKYAIGEIILVAVGILIALQVNNWNESRKERFQEIKSYENLMASLSADSSDVKRIIGAITLGMNAQKFFIRNSSEELIDKYTIQQIEDSLKIIDNIGTSFFPRFSAYDQLSNSGFQSLLQSEEIKNKLLELYDRKYKRYLQIDGSIDVKAEFNLAEIINGDLQIFRDESNIRPVNAFDVKKFEKYYPQLVREFSSMLITGENALDALYDSQDLINELLLLIDAELKHLKN